MVGLYKDPHGETIFKDSTSINNAISKDPTTETDVPALRKKIRELEHRLKENEVMIGMTRWEWCTYGVSIGEYEVSRQPLGICTI